MLKNEQINAEKEGWNKKNPIGSEGYLLLDLDGGLKKTKVRSKATEMCGTIVAWFEGVSGAYDITCWTNMDDVK